MSAELKPGYKQTEVGVIPEDWEAARLGDKTTKVGSGITPTGGERVYKQEGRPFLRSQNVGWGTLILDDIAFIDEDTHAKFQDTEIEICDVFLNITGASIGRSAVADCRVKRGNVNQHVCIIRTNQVQLHPRFLNYFLLSTAGQKQIESFQAGGNRQGLNFGQIRSFLIPLPPTKAEQEVIAEALSDADALIESLEQLIAKKRHLKQGATQELLTGKKRLPGFSGEWEEKRFADVAFPRRDRVDPRRTGVHEFCVELEHIESASGVLLGSTSTGDQSSLKSVFRPGDVLFGKLRAYLRKYWLATRSGVCSTEIWVFVPNDRLITTDYLFQLIKTDRFIEAASNAYGTHMPRSDWNVVKNYELPLPLLPEQAAIATILSDMDAEIAALEAKLAKARQIKQGMMQELLTGKTRLV
jgi:type I restriction enzyme S subunit